MEKMFVVKRNGKRENVYFDKITARNMKLSADLDVDTYSLSQMVIHGLQQGMTTRDIDKLSYESAIFRSIYEPDYGILASRIAWNDLHKNTPKTFNECIDKLYNNFNPAIKKKNSLLSDDVYFFAKENIDEIEKAIDYKKDYTYNYFAFKTLEKAYLQKSLSEDEYIQNKNSKIAERTQHMLMRVNLGIHGPSKRNGKIFSGRLDKALESYKAMSEKKFVHATPTLFNSGTKRPQDSSCFILECADSLGESEYNENEELIEVTEEDSIQKCWEHCGKISKNSGGIGITLTRVRCKGSYIAGSNGRSSGIIPLIRVFNNIARYIDQAGKRKGAIALYLEPWHPDTPEFLEVKLPNGTEELRARDIHIALWIPDLFFKRLEEDGDWSFFCPGTYPELVDLYGERFEERYIQLEKENKMCRRMKAKDLFEKVLHSLRESGEPYMLSKDHVNNKSNHQNIGTITSSNLCTEIMEYHNPRSIAVCNLASISLPAFVDEEKKTFDFKELGRITEIITENLNLIIDKNYYPVKYCADNNFSLRPIGIGVQGLADIFAMLHLAWESEEAKILNLLIFECIYFYALKKSAELSKEFGSYDRFEGSPVSKGILQFDMWNVKPITLENDSIFNCEKLEWEKLREEVKKGIRNSLLISPMPTATTSQILNNTECFEPNTSNIYARKVVAGDFPLVNNYLYKDLKKLGKWTKENVDEILKNDGSVQNLDIPQNLKNIYKTVWELPQKVILDMAADRGAFIDQSQSMNVYFKDPTPAKLASMYMYGWKKGLKTLSYYVRSQAKTDPIKFTIMGISDPTQKIKEELNKNKEKKSEEYICNDDVCMTCSS